MYLRRTVRINIFTINLQERYPRPLALINDGILQHFRVGGGTSSNYFGAKYLSRD